MVQTDQILVEKLTILERFEVTQNAVEYSLEGQLWDGKDNLKNPSWKFFPEKFQKFSIFFIESPLVYSLHYMENESYVPALYMTWIPMSSKRV